MVDVKEPVARNTVEFMVYGRSAMFSDITTRTGGERTSYSIPTYEALKGILHSIYWKPTIVWKIDAVRIMNPIQSFRRGIRPIKMSGGNDLAHNTYLDNVCYQVRAHFEWNLNRPELAQDRNEHKHHNIAKRMIERGGRRDVFLGTRECFAYVEPCKFGEGDGAYDTDGRKEFGLMLHGFTYADEAERDEDRGYLTVRLWNPVMENGIVRFIEPKDCTITRHIREMEIKPFGTEFGNFSGVDEPGLSEIGGD